MGVLACTNEAVMPINDNDFPRAGAAPPSPDAHGQAALLLVESLIHGLCENATLSANDAIEIAERAVAVQGEKAASADDAAAMWQTHALLAAIAASLKIDGDHTPSPPRSTP